MFRCFVCKLKLKDFINLKRHVTKHKIPNGTNITCNQNGCQRMYSSTKATYKHIRIRHKELFVNHTQNHCTIGSSSKSYNNVSLISINSNDPENAIDNHFSNNLAYVLNLCSLPNLTRKDIVSIVNFTKDFMQGINNDNSQFNNLDTDYHIQKTLEENGLLVNLKSILLGVEADDSVRRGVNRELIQRPIFGYYYEIRDIVSKIFKNINLFNRAMQYHARAVRL